MPYMYSVHNITCTCTLHMGMCISQIAIIQECILIKLVGVMYELQRDLATLTAESQPYQNGSILFAPDTLTTGKVEYWSL